MSYFLVYGFDFFLFRIASCGNVNVPEICAVPLNLVSKLLVIYSYTPVSLTNTLVLLFTKVSIITNVLTGSYRNILKDFTSMVKSVMLSEIHL